MWLLIIYGFLALTGTVWLLVIWPLAMSSNPTDPDQFLTYLIVTLAASAFIVLIGIGVIITLIQKLLRFL